jgi:hypothetical protein
VHRDANTFKHYGANWKLANKDQRQNRYQDGYVGAGSYKRKGRRRVTRRRYGYRGRGSYCGQGGFFGDLWGGIKSVARAALPIAEGFIPEKYQGLANAANTMLNPGDYDGDGDYGMAGMGDYGPVNSNSIVHGVPSNPSGIVAHTAPQTMMNDSGDIMLSHKEFLCNVLIAATSTGQTQSTFDNQVFPLNPGLQGTFPFLSQIAQCFTLYSMQGLMFQYKPTSGEMGVTSQQLGKVIMATDYDPQATPFINSVQMENYQFSNTAKPSIGQIHGVECKPSESLLDMKYVRTGASKRDPALTDIGLFQIATEGVPFPANTVVGTQVVIGELWASYTIKVSRANLYGSLLGQNIAFGQYLYTLLSTPTAPTLFLANSVNPVQNQNLSLASNVQTPFSIQLFNSINNATAPARYLGRSIAIQWPNQTILGTYTIRIAITCNQAARIGASSTTWYPSSATTAAVGSGVISNSANQFTQWVCPYDPTNMTLNGTLVYPPSINPQSGLPIQTTGSGNGLVNYVSYTSNFGLSRVTGSNAQVQTSNASSGATYVISFNVIINAPGISVPTLLLEELQGVVPATAAFQKWEATDTVQVFISQTNQLGSI